MTLHEFTRDFFTQHGCSVINPSHPAVHEWSIEYDRCRTGTLAEVQRKKLFYIAWFLADSNESELYYAILALLQAGAYDAAEALGMQK